MAKTTTGTVAATGKASGKKTKRSAKLSSNRVLGLYQQALEEGTTHDEFVQQLRRVGGYDSTAKAAARVHRFKSMMRKHHGAELVPLKNAPRMTKNSKALISNFSCLVKG